MDPYILVCAEQSLDEHLNYLVGVQHQDLLERFGPYKVYVEFLCMRKIQEYENLIEARKGILDIFAESTMNDVYRVWIEKHGDEEEEIVLELGCRWEMVFEEV